MYTWGTKKQDNILKSRIDRVYVSNKIIVVYQKVIASVNSDHQIVNTQIQIPTEYKRGNGYWKMNISILNDPD